MTAVYRKYGAGMMSALLIGAFSIWVSRMLPGDILSASVLALVLGMILNPVLRKVPQARAGIEFVSKKVLKAGIILMGITLSFSQVLQVGRYALVMMCFTLLTAFGGGYMLGRLFGVNWKLSSLLSASTVNMAACVISFWAANAERTRSKMAHSTARCGSGSRVLRPRRVTSR